MRSATNLSGRSMTDMRQRKDLVLQLLNEHRLMTIATIRIDGWPQATTVGYVNDGFLLYCFVARDSQKHTNISRDARVSIAIASDAPRPLDIKGLSLAGRAAVVDDRAEFDYVSALRLKRYPEYAALSAPQSPEDPTQRVSRRPASAGAVLLRISPEIFSVVDYSKGFGHSDLITFSARDLDVYLGERRDGWNDLS
jgi:general stress protein 26